MPKSCIRFSQLRQLLLDLEFAETVVPESHVAYRHEPSDTVILLPLYKANELVAPRHYVPVRTLLDAKQLLDGAEFDRLLPSSLAKQFVSG